MALYTGVNGSIQVHDGTNFVEMVDCTSWTFTTTSETKTFASCSTNGQRSVLAGIKAGSGSLAGYTDSAQHISSFIEAGDVVQLKLILDGARCHLLSAVITEVSETVNIEAQDVVSWTASFEAQSGWQLFQPV